MSKKFVQEGCFIHTRVYWYICVQWGVSVTRGRR